MKILVSDDVSEKGVELLRQHYDVDVKINLDEDALVACIVILLQYRSKKSVFT